MIARIVCALIVLSFTPQFAQAQSLKLGNACFLRTGSGTPEAAVIGSICDTYWRSDTGQIYTKTSGTATNTGWTLIASADQTIAFTSAAALNAALDSGRRLIGTYTGADLVNGAVFSNTDMTVTPSANLTKPLNGLGSSLKYAGTHSVPYAYANYGYFEVDDTAVVNGSGGFGAGVDGEFGNYSTTLAPRLTGISSSWGTGTGSSTTVASGVFVDAPWDTSGTVTNAIGIDIRDQTYPGATNNYAVRIESPNAGSAYSGVMANGAPFDAVQAVTVADNGGGTNAASTIIATAGQVEITCSDAQGCDITLSETGIRRGQRVTFVCLSTVASNFADTSGVSETAGVFACGQYDSISYRYISDRWVEVGRSNN